MTRICVVLASSSPARLKLLRSAGIDPEVRASGVDEEALTASFAGAALEHLVVALALAKAQDVAAQLPEPGSETLVVAADSLFRIDGEVVGKPGSPAAARQRLAGLAGRCGELLTGHALILLSGRERTSREAVAVTRVCFERYTAEELDAYVATGEPINVAGGFTLDGIAAPFIAGVQGDPSNVIGLSLPLLRRMAAALGIFWPDLWSVSPSEVERTPRNGNPRLP